MLIILRAGAGINLAGPLPPGGTTYEGEIDGTLTSRHSIALTCEAGVITLTLPEVIRILPQLQSFAMHGEPIVGPSYHCPHCGAISFNPNDIRERYCGKCHLYDDSHRGGHE